METTFYEFGVEYLRWTNEKGETFEAVKEQVDYYGKKFFEFDPQEELNAKYSWLREQEIM